MADLVKNEDYKPKNRIILKEECDSFLKINEEWFREAREICTYDQLCKFGSHLFDDYEHDYGTIVHAVSAFAVAAANFATRSEGLTGFQASCVKWDFIKYYEFLDNKIGFKLLNYDDMLYPQYEECFCPIISKGAFIKLQEEARKQLATSNPKHVSEKVWHHWESITAGEVPFGWKIEEDDE